jgi:hypothetical protein
LFFFHVTAFHRNRRFSAMHRYNRRCRNARWRRSLAMLLTLLLRLRSLPLQQTLTSLARFACPLGALVTYTTTDADFARMNAYARRSTSSLIVIATTIATTQTLTSLAGVFTPDTNQKKGVQVFDLLSEEVDAERSCRTAEIPEKWCACFQFKPGQRPVPENM